MIVEGLSWLGEVSLSSITEVTEAVEYRFYTEGKAESLGRSPLGILVLEDQSLGIYRGDLQEAVGAVVLARQGSTCCRSLGFDEERTSLGQGILSQSKAYVPGPGSPDLSPPDIVARRVL